MTDGANDDGPRARIANSIGHSCFAVGLAGVLAAGHSPVSVTPFPPGIQPVYREIGDWLVACDNTRQCVAKYVLGDHNGDTSPFDEDAGLTISREAGPSGDIFVEVTSGSKFDPGTIRVDGMALVGRFAWDNDDEGRGASIDGDAAMTFVRRLGNANAVSWSGSGHASTISLHGLAAVLVAMDEAQGRIGNTSALGRAGPRSASVTPAAVAPPIVRQGPKLSPLANGISLIAKLRRTQTLALKAHECDQQAGTDDSADPLNERVAIVLLGCGRFAYQTSVLAFVVPRGRPELAQPLVLATPGQSAPAKPEDAGEYVGGSYDPDSPVFSVFEKGRGMADCGESAEWTWDGRAFHLSALAHQQRCGGGPGDWPTLFRSRTVPMR